MLVGVDIGGTFTDLVLSKDGYLTIHKLPSTPHNPAQAMLEGLNTITGNQISALERVAHGSTVATNAILERKGAKTAFITTQGFRDVLMIGRQNRPVLYALQPQLSAPLIPRDQCYDVPERLDHQGEVILPLDMAAVDRVLDAIQAQGMESIAVCLLYSYINPVHERQIQDRIVERGLMERWQVALSHEVLPEFREYERASTVALEAYVRPVMGRYITKLEQQLPQGVGLRIMKSDGGVIGAERIKQQAIQTALSGPAAGVVGAYHIARLAGYENIITLDMGGTSTDVAVIPGEPIRRPQSEIDGLPLRIRLLDIETIGAGGGSIARVDAGGALRVGPQSAGAVPGPAVYQRGGAQATVSDANAVLGRLDADHFLGGGMPLDIEAGRRVVGEIAQQLNISVNDAAKGILEIANINIERAIRRVSVARGYDPRRFTLVVFGGAGALHACDVADRLQIPRVLVPRYPGVLCAFGLLVADVVLDYSQSIMRLVTSTTIDDLANLLEDMMEQAKNDLIQEGVTDRDHRLYHASLDVRYQGQAYELNVPVSDVVNDICEAFHRIHARTYGYAIEARAVEVVNLRLQAVGIVDHPVITAESEKVYQPRPSGQKGDFALYEREALKPGATFTGQALVFQLDSTIYIPTGWSARVDGYHNLILEHA
ncbi:MAG: 5-oxoprolinase [Phototrophicales bacterium]|nr:MAG: 5-oxoprolinase [Phototrophicales bacterium]RMG73866.1 MAG: hydantoinase/oxoprolinase family protein [Chloroflexota bacterium]